MRIVCLSDTHGKYRRISVPAGDLLIFAGDMTKRGSEEEVREFDRWLGSLPHRHKVVIAGNTDLVLDKVTQGSGLIQNAIYLEDSSCSIEGLLVWGSPATPWFFDWAFNYRRGPEIAAIWDRIPAAVDILITHGPPLAVLDTIHDGRNVGCADLARALTGRAQLKLHVFGHIHEAAGRLDVDDRIYVNAAICDHRHRPSNPPIVVDLG